MYRVFAKHLLREGVEVIAEEDKKMILRCARKYGVSAIVLFGSSLRDDSQANDIDLAVKGIAPELFKTLSKPVDLIDLGVKSPFSEYIEETGARIYGQTA